MTQDQSMRDYYARRAQEYEDIYRKPERQSDLEVLRRKLRECFAGLDVLEVACGTGYWTEVVAGSARSVVGMDVNEEVLAVARSKGLPGDRVFFRRGDAYALEGVEGRFTAGLAAFWWSHVPRRSWVPFLRACAARLEPGSTWVLMDNRFVEGSSTPLSRKDEQGDTFQMRRLKDGTEYEVMKNFPSEEELRSVVDQVAGMQVLAVDWTPYYWVLRCRTAGSTA